jgi:hypothetical protein
MFDFSKMDLNIPDMPKPKLVMPAYYEQLDKAVEGNELGLTASLGFNRYWLIMMFKLQINASLEALTENKFSQDDIDTFHIEIDRLIGKWFEKRDYQYPTVIAVMDHNVIRNAIERRSQVIGVSAYASMSLFVDLLLGLKRHHIDVFHTIDNRFDKVQSTKSLLLSYISSLIDLTTFTTGDYLAEPNAENNLKQILCDIALHRFDEATFFYAKENQWLNILSTLTDDKPDLSEVNDEGE